MKLELLEGVGDTIFPVNGMDFLQEPQKQSKVIIIDEAPPKPRPNCLPPKQELFHEEGEYAFYEEIKPSALTLPNVPPVVAQPLPQPKRARKKEVLTPIEATTTTVTPATPVVRGSVVLLYPSFALVCVCATFTISYCVLQDAKLSAIMGLAAATFLFLAQSERELPPPNSAIVPPNYPPIPPQPQPQATPKVEVKVEVKVS